MNGQNYIENILSKEVKQAIEKYPHTILQQGNAPCHTAKAVKNYLFNNQIDTLDWPANSPDLNIIENIWHTLKRKIRKTPIRNKPELIHKTKKVWNEEITPHYINKLINSMKNRLEAVIANKGGPSGY